MKVLVTGFTPFGEKELNPSFLAVKQLPKVIASATVITIELPTVFGESVEVLLRAIKQHRPQMVILVGQAGGRFGITLERVAINIDDARIPDNKGQQPTDNIIVQGAPTAYFSNLPIKAIVTELHRQNIPASVLNTAGTYVCNHVMYSLLHYIQNTNQEIYGGFLHVPYIFEQVLDKVNATAMNVTDITQGLAIAIETTIKYTKNTTSVNSDLT